MTLTRFLSLSLLFVLCCTKMLAQQNVTKNPSLNYQSYNPKSTDLKIDRAAYAEKLQGFWLATCIANWTGLVTEMDKIGNIGDIKTGPFYTRADWGQPDQGSIWAAGIPSNLSPTIDFVFADEDTLWGSDDDTDIEYIYQELLIQNQTSMLTGEQIRNGWMKHIKGEEENYLWVSNQKALDLMKSGLVPPATGAPEHNPEYEMIDAQLTTEIFGLYAPGRPDMAVKMATLPIQTTAREESEWISAYYVRLFSLASTADTSLPIKQQLTKMAEQAALELPASSYPVAMYHYVKGLYASGISWEQARDSVYQRYQVEQLDGYDISSRKMYCNGCFAAGINFASSLVSLFYGEGDLKETIKIGALAGWDSDNPTATWGGLIGFMLGKEGVEKAFGRKFSNKFHIHRTRVNFPNEGIDTFDAMAQKGLWIIDRVVQEELKGGVDLRSNSWYIPKN
ncbi:MAG: hypothetical protein RL403_1537 [Bacteroidota bacterium]